VKALDKAAKALTKIGEQRLFTPILPGIGELKERTDYQPRTGKIDIMVYWCADAALEIWDRYIDEKPTGNPDGKFCHLVGWVLRAVATKDHPALKNEKSMRRACEWVLSRRRGKHTTDWSFDD
jgi:hypothetical protein